MMTRNPPRSRRSIVYLVLGVLLIGLWGLGTAKGLEGSQTTVERIPPDVRSSPGGYRSFHFWHSGYRGGK